MMEIVASLPTSMNGASGGTKKHVEEWSRLDRLTGMLEHARVEADHWASTTSNSRHHFGKVVDSRARNLADGSVQQKQQTKQLEVFQAHIPGGSVQVIRSHTSTTSSWHNSKVLPSHTTGWSSSTANNLLNHHISKMEAQMDDLKFAHNSVNLNPEKTKVNVARSLINRRPPTRSRSSKTNLDGDNFFTDIPPITYEIEDKTTNEINIPINKVSNESEILLNGCVENDAISAERNDHEKLEKKKSISNENLSLGSYLETGKIDEKENSDPWKRSSKARWSFQCPSRYKKDENSTEKNQGTKSELESVLEKVLRRKGDFESYSKAAPVMEPPKPVSTWRRKSFVTEETLKATKQKLRRLTVDNISVKNDKEETDDGICTESKGNSDKEDEKMDTNPGFINSTIVENQLTNSLQSRTINKSDDWFDRRKSYGFESVQTQRNITSSLNNSPKTNLSTDSGICRSSESELVSTPIIKKLTEATEDRIRVTNEEENKYRESSAKNDVSELLQKFEKFDKPKIGSTVVTLTEEPKIKILEPFDKQRESIKKGKVQEAIRSLKKNAISCNAFEPMPFKANSYFLEQIAEKPNLTSLKPESDILSKRHSIACDDMTYMPSTFTISEPSFPEKVSLPGKTTVVNVNNFESDDVPLPVSDTEYIDIKKPKKVEFSKTEVHFAAAEPGKIKIVETDEKPPPNNLYRRKKRSFSASPKIGLPQIKFGDYEKSLLGDKSTEKNDDSISRSAECVKTGDKAMDYNSPYTSTTSDNGLAVTISSMKPTDYRRASWSVVENPSSSQIENKAGYSTKINFDGGGVTVVADVKTPQYEYEQPRKSFVELNEMKDKVCNFDASQNGENIQEKLIVRIGGSGAGCSTMEKYIQKPTFTNSFRNSISSGFVKLSKKSDDNLKSTSLIIDTIKKSMDVKMAKKSTNDEEKKINSMKTKQSTFKVEQPSTYITEMNKLQQKYRVIESRSTIGEVIRNENNKNRNYNTIPTTKNGYTRTKLLTNDLPSVLSAFDNLCRTIDKVMDENANEKIKNTKRSIEILKKFSTESKWVGKRSSQSRFLCNATSPDDGNISDDSLKADEEVRSYMSTAIMEEYENELCGSWSRKRYFKHIKPVKIVGQDEISDKSHFKPLKRDDDKFKTIANVTDVKKPKITSVAMKLSQDVWPDKNSLNSPKKSTTVLLNEAKTKTHFSDEIITKVGDSSNTERLAYKIGNSSPVKICNFEENNERKQSGNSIKISNDGIFKNENNEPVKIIYHDIKMIDKPHEEKRSPSPKKESDKDALKNSKKSNVKEVFNANGSIRRRTNPINDKEKLFDSGRDGWLNLPKERKSTSEKKIVENGKYKEISRKPHIDHVRKDRRMEKTLNGCGDISSEEDLTKKNKKLYKPLSTIDEKSNVLKVPSRLEKSDKLVKPKIPATRTTSNSSIESRSNSFDFKKPVLKTEERSKRRAARMLQRTSSREMLNWNAASSSEDVTSDNEMHYSRSNKSRNVRKVKSSPKSSKPTSNLPGSNRVVTQHSTAKMQINIFNMKEKPNEGKMKSNHSHYVNAKSSNSIDGNGLLKSKSHTGQKEISANSSLRSRTSKPVTVTSSNRDSKKLSCSSVKSCRPIR